MFFLLASSCRCSFFFVVVAASLILGLTNNHLAGGFLMKSNEGLREGCSPWSFVPRNRHHQEAAHPAQHSSSRTALWWYRNGTVSMLDTPPSYTVTRRTAQWEPSTRRQQLKQALAVAAIEDYDMEAYYQSRTTTTTTSTTTTSNAPAVLGTTSSATTTEAEDIMKELEAVNPWPNPAHHPLLNARWSFVFTGVPTFGMKLITLLSRISVGFSKSVLEFDNVFLEVAHQQSQVKAIVRVEVMGQPVELNVFTKLRLPTTHDPKGTLLIESFDRLVLMGVEIPTPESWKSCRELQITYLDEDMMIARTAGGEPHLLLRHSPCSTDDDTCDLDDANPTPFFQDAMTKYGRHLSRSLVDRAYSMDDDEKTAGGLDVVNILRLIQGIVHAPNGGH